MDQPLVHSFQSIPENEETEEKDGEGAEADEEGGQHVTREAWPIGSHDHRFGVEGPEELNGDMDQGNVQSPDDPNHRREPLRLRGILSG
jgi:hypothetical protein